MSGDSIRTITLKVNVQENGIIRLAQTGRFIGRLSGDEETDFHTLSRHDLNRTLHQFIPLKLLPEIQKALGIELYEGQIRYLCGSGRYWFGDRQCGKTTAYCIGLALSKGEPLDMKYPETLCDPDFEVGDVKNYAKYCFKKVFREIWQSLKDYGLPVREVRRWE